MKGLLFTYALTYGGAVVSLFNPWYGLLIYICFATVRPDSLWFWSVPVGNYSRIVAMGLLVGWGLHGFGNWSFGRARPIVYALLAFWAWSILCGVFADNSAAAWGFVESKSKIFLPFLVGATLIDSLDRVKQLAWVLVLSQGYVAYDLNMAYYDGFNRLMEVGFGGMDNNCVSISMVAGVGLAFFLGIAESLWWRKLLAFAAAALMTHVPMFGMSRGGMLGLIVTGVVAFWLIPKEPKQYAVFALAVVVALSLAGPPVVARFATVFASKEERDQSAQSRLEQWRDCWRAMLDHPVVGVGPDNWVSAQRNYGWSRGADGRPVGLEAHSLWFTTGAEMGFPGIGFLLAFYGFAVLRPWRAIQDGFFTDFWATHLARMTIASIAGFCTAVSFVSLEGLEFPYYVVLIGCGVLMLACEEPRAEDGARRTENGGRRTEGGSRRAEVGPLTTDN